MTLIFTKAKNELSRGLADKDEDGKQRRLIAPTGERKGTKATVQLVDVLLGIARETDRHGKERARPARLGDA